MRAVYIFISFFLFIFLLACNSGNDKKATGNSGKTDAEKLFEEIDSIHIRGMSKMAKLSKLRQETTRVIDSVTAGTKKVSATFRHELDSALQNLSDAEVTMEKWMMDFYRDMDTLADKTEERMKYLATEKVKVSNLIDAIYNSIKRADSLLGQGR